MSKLLPRTRRTSQDKYCLLVFEKEIILKEQIAARCLFQCSVELADPCFGFPRVSDRGCRGFQLIESSLNALLH
jgi:hypothetical protein